MERWLAAQGGEVARAGRHGEVTGESSAYFNLD